MSNFWYNETFLQLFVPLLGALFVTFFTWRLNRTLSQGRPMSAFVKKLLSHGFLFMLGLGLLITWNAELATFLRFPGREVWRPLGVAWAVVLCYDAGRRLSEKHSTQEISEDASPGVRGAEGSWRANIVTLFRFLLFFSILGAIGRPGIAAFAVVAVLIVGLFTVGKLWKPPRGIS